MIALILNAIYLSMTIYRVATTDWDVLMEEYNRQLEQYQ